VDFAATRLYDEGTPDFSDFENATGNSKKRCRRICNCWWNRFVAQGMSQATQWRRRDVSSEIPHCTGRTRRELRTLVSIEDLGRDLCYALRSSDEVVAFAAVAIATLGLGLAPRPRFFSVIDNVLLEPFSLQGCQTHSLSTDSRYWPRTGRRPPGIYIE